MKNVGLFILCFFAGFWFYQKSGEFSLWYDELATWQTVSQSSWKNFWNIYKEIQAHPPLYFTLQHSLSALEDFSEINLRWISIFCTCLSVFVLGRSFIKLNLGYMAFLLAGFIFLDLDFFNYALEARPYALFLFLFSIRFSFYLTKDLSYKEKPYLLLLLDCALLSVHYYGFFAVVGFWIVSEFKTLANWKSLKRQGVYLSVLLVIFILFSSKDFQERFTYLEAYRFKDFQFINSYFINWSVFLGIICAYLACLFLDLKTTSRKLSLKSLYYLVAASVPIFLVSSFFPIWARPYTLFLKLSFIIFILCAILFILENVEHSLVTKKIQKPLIFILIGFFIFENRLQSEVFFGNEKKINNASYDELFKILNNKAGQKTGVLIYDSSPQVFKYYSQKHKLDKKVQAIDFIDNKSSFLHMKHNVQLGLYTEYSDPMYMIFKIDQIKTDLFKIISVQGFAAKIVYNKEDLYLIEFKNLN